VSKFEILMDEPKKGKIRIKQGLADRVNYTFGFIILVIISIAFLVFGFIQLFVDGTNGIEEIIHISSKQILYTVFLTIIYSHFITILFLELYNSKDSLKKVIYGGEIYEFNREKNVLLINNREEFSLDDIKRIHLRTFHLSSENDLYRLYIKTSNGGKKFICQYENYEDIHALAMFISRYLTIPITIK